MTKLRNAKLRNIKEQDEIVELSYQDENIENNFKR